MVRHSLATQYLDGEKSDKTTTDNSGAGTTDERTILDKVGDFLSKVIGANSGSSVVVNSPSSGPSNNTPIWVGLLFVTLLVGLGLLIRNKVI